MRATRAMNARRWIALGVMALQCAATAAAADWKEFARNGDDHRRNIISFDKASIVQTGNAREVWVKLAGITLDADGSYKLTGDDATYLYRMDCPDRTYATLKVIANPTNSPQEDYSDKYDHLPEAIAPGTWMEELHRLVCTAANTSDPQRTGNDISKADSQSDGADSTSAAIAPPDSIKVVRMPDCADDYYPAEALRLNQHGSVVVKVCVAANNKVDGAAETVTSSGFPLLDDAAGKCLAAGSYKSATSNGMAIASCKDFKVEFRARIVR